MFLIFLFIKFNILMFFQDENFVTQKINHENKNIIEIAILLSWFLLEA